jgi:hypothetical protein
VAHQDVKPKVIISTAGNTSTSPTPHKREYQVLPPSGKDKRVSVEIPWPTMVAEHFAATGGIDNHNKRRQGLSLPFIFCYLIVTWNYEIILRFQTFNLTKKFIDV